MSSLRRRSESSPTQCAAPTEKAEAVSWLARGINIGGVFDHIDAMHSLQWRNEVAPRALFEMMRYKPGARAHRLAMPVLVCLAEHDRESPVELARQIADHAPHGELKIYPCAHFDFCSPEVRVQVVGDQIDFLRKHLMVNRQ